MTRKRTRSGLAPVVALAVALSALFTMTAAVSADPDPTIHCPGDSTGEGAPDGAINGASGSTTLEGVEFSWSGDPGVITVENTTDDDVLVEFCVKSGNDLDGAGNKFLVFSDVIAAGATVTFNIDKEVSYFVVYDVTVEEPPQLTDTTAAAASVTAPTCSAVGSLVVPADTASVMYSVSPAYSAGATGAFTVSATAKAGFVLTGTSQWVLNVAPKLTGAQCEGTLGGNPTPTPSTPVRSGTQGGGSIPNTALDQPADANLGTLLAILALASSAAIVGRNLVVPRRRR